MARKVWFLREVLHLAWGSLMAHRLRGGLTILGIVIGITSVVSMVSLIEGLNRSVTDQLANLGTDVIRIRRFDPAVVVGELPDSLRNRSTFDHADAEGIREHAPSILAVTETKITSQRLTYKGEQSRMTDIRGVDRWFLLVQSFALEDGRPPTEAEYRGGARVGMIGHDVAEQLFENVDPVGEVLGIRNQKFEIIGVLARRGNFLGQSLDNVVLIPLDAMDRHLAGTQNRLRITAKPVSAELVPRAKEELIESLRRTRGLRPQDANDFALVTQDNLLGLYRSITGAFFMVVVAIASVALLVGGIGVMNIMLVSVTERTREIGIRKALGARQSHILLQFLAEAVALTAAGGVIGVAVGFSIGALVNLLTPLPAYTPPWAYFAAVGVSSAVGIFFGFWPAVRASRLNPVDALRYE